VRRLCSKAILLDQGSIVAMGPIDEVLERYAAMVGARA
jgi:ABC-type polysaccharide/polyol phosphate transport system ATPase subunit